MTVGQRPQRTQGELGISQTYRVLQSQATGPPGRSPGKRLRLVVEQYEADRQGVTQVDPG